MENCSSFLFFCQNLVALAGHRRQIFFTRSTFPPDIYFIMEQLQGEPPPPLPLANNKQHPDFVLKKM
jgi:hypothetical protein